MTQLNLQRVGLRYGDAAALIDASACFESGQLVALVGPNGAGKSTLLRVCAGLADPSDGIVCLDDAPIGSLKFAARARRISYLPPDGRSAWALKVHTIVALGRVPHLKPLRRLSARDEAAIKEALDRAGVSHLSDRRFDTLSSGERARVLIARSLSTQADVLLLDEPTAALDPKHQLAVMEILKAEADRGRLVIVAAHALELVARYADRVVVLQDGVIWEDGPPATSLSEAVVRDVFGVTAPGGVVPTRLELL